MFHLFDASGSISGLQRLVREALDRGCAGLQILGTVENGWTSRDLAEIGALASVPIFGGLFPQIVHETEALSRGTVVIAHGERPTVLLVRHSDAIGVAGLRWPDELADAATLIVYVDATCDTMRFTGLLFEEVGAGPTFVGGGAGALDFERRPVIIASDGLHEGAAVIAGFRSAAGVAVSHGWRPIGESMTVTGGAGGTVSSIDWRPAIEAYRGVVEQHAGEPLTTERFGDLASAYPFILERIGAEGVVRDPLVLTPEGALRCAGGIPPHATVRIATATPREMVEAAAGAREQALRRAQGPLSIALTIDCISRGLLLKEGLKAELEALKVPGVPQVGALTIGEIANNGEDFLEFYNKTTVLALLSEQAAP